MESRKRKRKRNKKKDHFIMNDDMDKAYADLTFNQLDKDLSTFVISIFFT